MASYKNMITTDQNVVAYNNIPHMVIHCYLWCGFAISSFLDSNNIPHMVTSKKFKTKNKKL